MDQTQIISLAQKAQRKRLELEEILYVKELEEVKISDLKKPSYHQRVVIDSRLKQLVCSLKDYGFLGGVFIHDKTLNVIDGWYRAEIWRELGHQTIPCYRIDCTNFQQVELHLKLNQQAAIFNPADFGLEFHGLDLIEDYGFSEADLAVVPSLPQQKEKSAKDDPDGYTKLSTLVRLSTMQKLKALKESANLATIGDVVEALIEKA